MLLVCACGWEEVLVFLIVESLLEFSGGASIRASWVLSIITVQYLRSGWRVSAQAVVKNLLRCSFYFLSGEVMDKL